MSTLSTAFLVLFFVSSQHIGASEQLVHKNSWSQKFKLNFKDNSFFKAISPKTVGIGVAVLSFAYYGITLCKNKMQYEKLCNDIKGNGKQKYIEQMNDDKYKNLDKDCAKEKHITEMFFSETNGKCDYIVRNKDTQYNIPMIVRKNPSSFVPSRVLSLHVIKESAPVMTDIIICEIETRENELNNSLDSIKKNRIYVDRHKLWATIFNPWFSGYSALECEITGTSNTQGYLKKICELKKHLSKKKNKQNLNLMIHRKLFELQEDQS